MTTRFLLLISIFLMSYQVTYSQEETIIEDTTITEMNDDTTMTANMQDEVETSETMIEETKTPSSPSFHQVLKTKFIEGGAGFMGIVLLTLILGLALCIERIIYLHAAGSTDNEELLGAIEKALKIIHPVKL